MKRCLRVFAFVLLAALAVSLAACGMPQPTSYYGGGNNGGYSGGNNGGNNGGNTYVEPAQQPMITPVPVVVVTPEPVVVTPAPTAEPYYLKLMEKIAARDSRIVLPPEAAFFDENEICTKYVQGIYGQGIMLMTAPADGEKISTLLEGTRLTVYAVQGDRGLVLTEDGRYGWAVTSRMVDRFDPDLSYQRKREYLINSPNDWTNPSWYSFIMDHADDLPWEIVVAAREAKK